MLDNPAGKLFFGNNEGSATKRFSTEMKSLFSEHENELDLLGHNKMTLASIHGEKVHLRL